MPPPMLLVPCWLMAGTENLDSGQGGLGRALADQRELLFDLEQVVAGLPDSQTRILIEKSIGNLLLIWSGV